MSRTKEESQIIINNILKYDPKTTLSEIAKNLNVSREYVRQVRKKYNIKRYIYADTFTKEQLEDIKKMFLSSEYSCKDITTKYNITPIQLLRLKRKLAIKKSNRVKAYKSKYDIILKKFANNEFKDKSRQEIMKENNLTPKNFRSIVVRLKYRGQPCIYKKLKPGRQK